MEQSYMRVDACRPIAINLQSCCYLNCCCSYYYYYCYSYCYCYCYFYFYFYFYCYFYRESCCVKPLLQGAATATATAKSCCSLNCCITARSFAFDYSWLQPLLIRARSHGSRVVRIASTSYCVTALPCSTSTTTANCHQRYGSKQRGGKTASMGSVICRSMENSVCERLRMQLAEARGIGGLICRIDVTGISSDRRGAGNFDRLGRSQVCRQADERGGSGNARLKHASVSNATASQQNGHTRTECANSRASDGTFAIARSASRIASLAHIAMQDLAQKSRIRTINRAQ
jgi:hypothetical protein